MASMNSDPSDATEDQAEPDAGKVRHETTTAEGQALGRNDDGSFLQEAIVAANNSVDAFNGSNIVKQTMVQAHAGGAGSGGNSNNGRMPAEIKEDLARVAESLREDAKEGEKNY